MTVSVRLNDLEPINSYSFWNYILAKPILQLARRTCLLIQTLLCKTTFETLKIAQKLLFPLCIEFRETFIL